MKIKLAVLSLFLVFLFLPWTKVQALNIPGFTDTVHSSLLASKEGRWKLLMMLQRSGVDISALDIDTLKLKGYIKRPFIIRSTASFLFFLGQWDNKTEVEFFLSSNRINVQNAGNDYREINYGATVVSNVCIIAVFLCIAGAVEITKNGLRNGFRYFFITLFAPLFLALFVENQEDMMLTPTFFCSLTAVMIVKVKSRIQNPKNRIQIKQEVSNDN